MRKIYDLWWAFAVKRILGEPEPAHYFFPAYSVCMISCCGLMVFYTAIGVIPVTKHLNSGHIILMTATIIYGASIVYLFGMTTEILLKYMEYINDKKKAKGNTPNNNTQDKQNTIEFRIHRFGNFRIQPFTSHVSSKKPFDSQQNFSTIIVGTIRDGVADKHYNRYCKEKTKDENIIKSNFSKVDYEKQNQCFDGIYNVSTSKNNESGKNTVYLGDIAVERVFTNPAKGKQSDLNFKTAKLSRVYLRPLAYLDFFCRCFKNIPKKGMSKLMGQMQKENAKIPGDGDNNHHQNEQHSFVEQLSLCERFLLIATASFWVPLALLDRREQLRQEDMDYDALREKADMLRLTDAVKAIPILMLHVSIIFSAYKQISALFKTTTRFFGVIKW